MADFWSQFPTTGAEMPQFQPAPVGTQPSQPLPYGPGGTDFGMLPEKSPFKLDPATLATLGQGMQHISGVIGGGSDAPVPWSLQNGLGPNAIQRAQAILAQHPSGIWGGVANKLLGMAQSGQLQQLATPQGQLAAMESKFQQHPNDFWSHLSTGMLGLAGQFGGNGGMNAGNGGQSAYPTTAQPAYQPVPADLSNPQNRSSY